MIGEVQALYRYPVKGFTPEPVAVAALRAGAYFPEDRLYAVENGPSGFDPAAPAHISKHRFTVLAPIPEVARVRTRYDGGMLSAEAEGYGATRVDLRSRVGRIAFAAWLETALHPDSLNGPLKVVHAPGHHFTDSRNGFVSVLNLASVAALGEKMGADLDPLRFRANVYVSGWPAWVESDWRSGMRLHLGGAEVELLKPIVRCIATHVDPVTGVRDQNVLGALRQFEGHVDCGLYVRVVEDGEVRVGDRVEAISA